jgi:hypothetical protein
VRLCPLARCHQLGAATRKALPCAQLLPLPGRAPYRRDVAEYLDLEAVAEILGVDPYTAYVLVRTGDLRAMKISVGWRVERADVLRYRAGR